MSRGRFDAPQDTTLFYAIAECRVFKSEKEQEVMRFMNIISSEAHMAVMRCCAPGLFEYAAVRSCYAAVASLD